MSDHRLMFERPLVMSGQGFLAGPRRYHLLPNMILRFLVVLQVLRSLSSGVRQRWERCLSRSLVLGRLAHLADLVIVGKVEGGTVLVSFQRSLAVGVGLSLVGVLGNCAADFLKRLFDQGPRLAHQACSLIRILPLDIAGTHIGCAGHLGRVQVSGAGLIGFDVGHSIGFLEPAKETSEQAADASRQAEQPSSLLGIGLLHSRRSRRVSRPSHALVSRGLLLEGVLLNVALCRNERLGQGALLDALSHQVACATAADVRSAQARRLRTDRLIDFPIKLGLLDGRGHARDADILRRYIRSLGVIARSRQVTLAKEGRSRRRTLGSKELPKTADEAAKPAQHVRCPQFR